MKMRSVLLGVMGAALLAGLGFGGWILSLPTTPTGLVAPPIAQSETAAMLDRLKPPKRRRPLIAIIGLNDATETTDYLMTAGILRRADVADVVMLATDPGPVLLYPALTVEPDATLAEFDAAHPEGADYVVVPAMSREDPAVIDWLKDQSANGATIIGICAGAKVVAAAGLLDGRRATTHWYYLDEMLGRHPSITYVANRRMVADGRVVTTTGITASMPMMLTLIEAIAGRTKAETVARDLGLEAWDARHASGAFAITRPFATTVLHNRLAFWKNEDVGIQLMSGMDEISLALTADAWSRTYRSQAVTFAASPVETRSGIRIIPDRLAETWSDGLLIPSSDGQRPVRNLEEALAAIAARYGAPTKHVVAMQLEYPETTSAP